MKNKGGRPKIANPLTDRTVILLTEREARSLDRRRGSQSRSQFIRAQLATVGIFYTQTKPLEASDVSVTVEPVSETAVGMADSETVNV